MRVTTILHHGMRSAARWAAAAAVAVLFCGCAYYPKTVEYYDADCRIVHKKLVVAKSAYGSSRHCTNEGCIAALLSIPVEALVAGSVVFVGNTVLWLEKEGRCLIREDGADGPPRKAL